MRPISLPVLLLFGLGGKLAGAQESIPERDIGAALRTYSEQFTDIGYAVPLESGSLMVADFGEMTLWRIDGRTGAARQVGRKGSGPKEYQVAGQLVRLRGDTIAMYDAAQMRMLLITAAGDPVRTVTLTTNRMQMLSLPQPFGTDSRGRVYAHVFASKRGSGKDSTRSRIEVVRMETLTSSRYDTLTTLWFENLAPTRKPLAAGHTLQVRVNTTSLHTSDAAVVTQTGELVVLRGADFTIEFLDTQGSKRRDVRVPSARYPLTPDERQALVQLTRDRTAKGTAHARRLMDANVPTPLVVIEEPEKWPALKPVFQQGARRSDNGRLYVPVFCRTPGRQCLDVLSEAGVREVRYRLPERARFLTVSNQHIFLVLRDADDLETVSVYPAR